MSRIEGIKRGRMSESDRAEIRRLVDTMEKPTAGKIARKLNRHPATVNWFMLRQGLIERKAGRAPRVYTRNGITIHPYTEEHDARLEELRTSGKVYREIAEILTSEFGIHRTAHSVQVRNTQLAASPE